MPDMIVASTTATQEEIDHAVSPDWRAPIAVKEPEKPATEETEKPAEEQETAEATEETQEVKTVPDSETVEEQEEKPVKGKGGFQKKIDKLTKEKNEEKSRAELLAQELADFRERFTAIEQRLAGKPAATTEEKPEAKTSNAPPKPLESEIGTKFKDWTEYNEALIDWKADRKLDARLAERDQSAQERETRENAQERDEGYSTAAKEFIATAPDFNEAVTAASKAGMKLPEPIIELIKELPNGPAVTYYLVKNPDEALSLIQMSPAMGFAAIGRISQGLESEAKPADKPPAKKVVSTAPAAVKPVAGHSARSGNSLQEISARDTGEYVRVRMAQLKEKEARRYS
jgi:hypothetical protein